MSLSQFRGHPTILAFYPADFSPVCGDQMTLYNEILPEFQRFNAELVGVSVDGVWSHRAFSKDRNLHFLLLSDFEPKGEVGSYVFPIGVNPGAEGILKALESITVSESINVENMTEESESG
jgi:peroxiredoxin